MARVAAALVAAPLVVAALAAVAPSPAGAWGDPQRANPVGTEGRSPAVAMNRAGTAAVAWVQGPWNRRAIVVEVRSGTGRWDAPVRISSRRWPSIDPRVVVDGSGRVVALWRQLVGRQTVRIGGTPRRRPVWVARARVRGADGTWGPVRTLSPRRLKVGVPELGVDAGGDAVAAWHWGTGTSPRVAGFVGQVQAARMVDGEWGAPRRLSGTAGCQEERRPRVAVGSRGHAVVWWQCDVRGGSTAIAVARGPGDAAWSARTELPFRTRSDQRADLGVAADGSVTAVSAPRGGTVRWWRGAAGDDGLRLRALPQPPASDRVDESAGGPRIAVDTSGDALSAWVASGNGGAVRAAPVASSLGAGAPTTLAGGAPARGLGISAGADRRGGISWLARAGGRDAGVLAAVRDEGGVWSAPQRISPVGAIVPGSSPRMAGAGARTVVAWERVVPGGWRIIERAEFPAP